MRALTEAGWVSGCDWAKMTRADCDRARVERRAELLIAESLGLAPPKPSLDYRRAAAKLRKG